MKEEAVIDRSR